MGIMKTTIKGIAIVLAAAGLVFGLSAARPTAARADDSAQGSAEISVQVAQAPTITTDAIVNAVAGESYSATLEATAWPSVKTWSWKAASGSSLPEGLSLGATDGKISGTPLKAGVYSIVVTADNGVSPAASKTLSLKVKDKYKQLTGTAYISISNEAKYMKSTGEVSGTVMAYVPVDLAEVSKVDLDKHGLGKYKLATTASGAGYEYETTLLQMFVYVLDTYDAAGSEGMSVTGSPHSSFIDGFMGISGHNFTYYVNGQYALDSSLGPNMGASSDVVVLSDGDYCDVSLYTDTSFYSDPAAGYHYFLDKEGAITHGYKAVSGTVLRLWLGRAHGDISAGEETTIVKEPGYTIYYGKSYGKEAGSVTTDWSGGAKITFPSSGTWYIWCDGGYGKTDTSYIVNSPGFAKVEVAGWDSLAGEDRYDTMQAIVSSGFASSATAIVASGKDFPDALAASALAGSLACPVVLTDPASLSAQAKSSIESLGAKRVIIIGGTGAVSSAVETAIEGTANKPSVDRIAGATRTDTAISIASYSQGFSDEACIIAYGNNFADALAISPYAYATHTRIYLTQKDHTLDSNTVMAIGASGCKRVIIVGGTAAVDDSVKQQLSGIGARFVRLAGGSRYDTASAIACWTTGVNVTQKESSITFKASDINGGELLSWSTVGVATGKGFPDALAGAALIGARKGTLLLVDPESSDGGICVNRALASYGMKSSAMEGYFFGGTAVVKQSIKDACIAASA